MSVALLRWQEVGNVLQAGHFWKSGEEEKDEQKGEENTDDDEDFRRNLGRFSVALACLHSKINNRLFWNGWHCIQRCSSVYFDDCQPN